MKMTIAEYVRKHRLQKKWSSRELGRRSGLSVTAIAKIECGATKNLRLKTALGLAKALGLNHMRLLGY